MYRVTAVGNAVDQGGSSGGTERSLSTIAPDVSRKGVPCTPESEYQVEDLKADMRGSDESLRKSRVAAINYRWSYATIFFGSESSSFRFYREVKWCG